MSFQLGETQAKLQLLSAPQPESEARPVETQPTQQVSDTIEIPSEPAPTPSAVPAGEPTKRGFFSRILGR